MTEEEKKKIEEEKKKIEEEKKKIELESEVVREVTNSYEIKLKNMEEKYKKDLALELVKEREKNKNVVKAILLGRKEIKQDDENEEDIEESYYDKVLKETQKKLKLK